MLILDEPTNHLDIASKEVFEDALMEYPGTVIVVSHDRYFLNKIPTRILELEKDGLTEYLGTYDYYVEKKAAVESGRRYLKEMAASGVSQGTARKNADGTDAANAGGAASQVMSAVSDVSGPSAPHTENRRPLSSAEERALKKKQEAEERRAAREKERLEKLIEECENAITANEAEMCREENLTNHQYLTELSEKNEELRKTLDDAYEKWLEM